MNTDPTESGIYIYNWKEKFYCELIEAETEKHPEGYLDEARDPEDITHFGTVREAELAIVACFDLNHEDDEHSEYSVHNVYIRTEVPVDGITRLNYKERILNVEK